MAMKTHVEQLLEKWDKRYWEVQRLRRMADFPPDQEDCIEECITDLKEAIDLDEAEKVK